MRRSRILPRTGDDLYNKVQPRAELIKGVIQIGLGFAVIIIFAYQATNHGNKQFDITISALRLVGYGLAVSAAVELAYTFFTKGPDEALDPLILGVSSFTLIALSEIDPPKLRTSDAIPISLLALAILLLFLARRFLLEVKDEAPDAAAYLAFQLGRALRRRRMDLKLSEEELAARAGITRPALVNIEAGHAIPTIAVLQLISVALDAEFVIAPVERSLHPDGLETRQKGPFLGGDAGYPAWYFQPIAAVKAINLTETGCSIAYTRGSLGRLLPCTFANFTSC